MTTNHQRFACEVNAIEQQRRCGLNPADAVWRAQQCIPDEYDCDDTPELCGLNDEDIQAACVLFSGLRDRGAWDDGNVFLSVVLSDAKWQELQRLIESNDMADDAPLGLMIRKVIQG